MRNHKSQETDISMLCRVSEKNNFIDDDDELYHCGLYPCSNCSSPVMCEAVDATASISRTSICPYYWKPIPQTQEEVELLYYK